MSAPRVVSLIVTTYERPDALARVLESLARQQDGAQDRMQDQAFEILVADDGSGPATAAAIEQFRTANGLAVQHVWQPHRGFRAAELRNRAVAASCGDYLIFIDGDCLAPRDFVAGHRRLAEAGWFVAGNRALLSAALAQAVLASPQLAADCAQRSLAGWLIARARGELNRLAPLLRLGAAWPRRRKARDWRGAKTCNLAVWRADFLRIDGFDERYVGWGHEDADLAVRLIRSGVLRKDGRFAVPVLHLWHPPAPRGGLNANEERLAEVLAADRVRALTGFSSRGSSPTSIKASRAAVDRPVE